MPHGSGWVRRQSGVFLPVMRLGDAATALATVLAHMAGRRHESAGLDLGPLGLV
jgi:hypothetical protein